MEILKTYITGYWCIKENSKHQDDHYRNLIPKTFEILKNCNIVFFYDSDEVLNFVKKEVKTKNIIYKKMEINLLETYKISYDYLLSCKRQDNKKLLEINNGKISGEKGLIHYSREYKKSGEECFRKVFSIWTSKIYLVNKIIEDNPFNSNIFAWIDISVSRFKFRKTKLYRGNNYSPNKIGHFGTNMKYYARKLPLSASFLIAHKKTWESLTKYYSRQIEESKDSNYAHDEETLLSLIWDKNRELFFNVSNRQPKDPEILYKTVKKLRSDKRFGWAIAAIFTYGCRVHEVWTLKPLKGHIAECLDFNKKHSEVKLKYCYALPKEYVEEFDLYNVQRKLGFSGVESYDFKKAANESYAFSKWLKTYFGDSEDSFDLNDLRHHWGIKSAKSEFSNAKAAASMGHTLKKYEDIYLSISE